MSDSFADNGRLSKLAVRTEKGIVAAQNSKAAAVGADILAGGGNAVDAAIATSLALGAAEPWMSGLGGGGCMLVYRAEHEAVRAVDFGMVAPRGLDPADYPLSEGADDELFGWPAVEAGRNLKGPTAFAVPGYLDGIGTALEAFGTQSLGDLVRPALALAVQGLEVDWYSALSIATAARELAEFEGTAATYLPGGFPPAPDPMGAPSFLSLGHLVDSLGHIAVEGHRTLYEGSLKNAFLRDMAEVGGRIDAADLETYKSRIVEPRHFRYKEADIWAMPGLFAGVSLERAAGIAAPHAFTGDWPDADAFLTYADALKTAYAERLERIGDDPRSPACTTHISVIDRAGNIVALTQTLLSRFGSKVLLPETGILMNNGVMWFDPRPGRPNSIAPGKRPLSNMCPVIAMNADCRLGLGASGGRRIMPAVMQLLSFVFDYQMSLEEAFTQGRIDVSGGETVTVNRLTPREIQDALAARHPIKALRNTVYPMQFACGNAVMHDFVDGMHYGMAEIVQPWADAVAEPDASGEGRR